MTEKELDKKLKLILTPPNCGKCEKCNSSKLTNEQVLQIRQMYDEGFSPISIADKFNTSLNNVYIIGKRCTWNCTMIS